MAQAELLAEDYKVDLDIFEGPLDLLLYLIRREELDIYDIPIERITKQYMAYLDLMRQYIHLLCRIIINKSLCHRDAVFSDTLCAIFSAHNLRKIYMSDLFEVFKCCKGI